SGRARVARAGALVQRRRGSLCARHSSAPSLGSQGSGRSAVKKVLPKHLVEIYDVDVQLGKGAFSTVWHCVHRASGQPRAMKRIDTSELCPREIAHEIALMR
ncbi:unnamed protein product, partial [Prorocentrum cordatum]